MKSIGFLLIGIVGVVWSVGCAQGSDSFDGDGGSNGNGGSSGGPAAAGSGGATSSATTSGSTTSSGTGSGGGGVGGGGGGGPECGANQHSCGGICTGNTPQTGCFTSSTCVACTPPQNGTAICSIDGECDFTCPAGYQQNGNACSCAQQCCSNADCPAGETCGGGVCSGPACDMNACIAQCIIMGCVGICMGDCVCLC